MRSLERSFGRLKFLVVRIAADRYSRRRLWTRGPLKITYSWQAPVSGTLICARLATRTGFGTTRRNRLYSGERVNAGDIWGLHLGIP